MRVDEVRTAATIDLRSALRITNLSASSSIQLHRGVQYKCVYINRNHTPALQNDIRQLSLYQAYSPQIKQIHEQIASK